MLSAGQKASLIAGLVGTSVLFGFSVSLDGARGLLGASMGFLVSLWSVLSLAVLVRALIRDRPEPAKGVRLTLITAILKLPVTLIGLYVGTRLPQPALGCFLAGLGLVYCCSVWFLAGVSFD